MTCRGGQGSPAVVELFGCCGHFVIPRMQRAALTLGDILDDEVTGPCVIPTNTRSLRGQAVQAFSA